MYKVITIYNYEPNHVVENKLWLKVNLGKPSFGHMILR